MKYRGIIVVIYLWANNTLALESDFFLTSQWLWQHNTIAANNDNNPDNRIFNLAEDRAALELRPTLESQWQNLSLTLDPRFVYLAEKNDRNLNDEVSDAGLRYWQSEWQGQRFSLTAGQYVQLWGPSVIFSPSNRYHIDNGNTNPNSELLAREFVEADWFINEAWDLQIVANVGDGDQNLENFKRSGDLRLSWTGEAISTTWQTTWLNPGWGAGGLIQWTVNGALLLYADGLYAGFNKGNFLDRTSSSNKSTRVVSGFSYTFNNGSTVAVDYYYNGTGLSAKTGQAQLQQSIDAASQIVEGDTSPALIDTIRQINNQAFFTLSKRYAVVRLSHNALWDYLSASFIFISNLEDRSRQHILSLDSDYGKTLSLFAHINIFKGDSLTEFGRFFDHQVSLGLRWVMY